jgi:hypothetical protein
MPAGLNGAFTFGSAEKPAQMAALELPGGASLLLTALFLFPAGDQVLLSASLVAEKEKNLPFNMRWNCPSALLVAMNGLNRNPQEIGKLFLGPSEFFSCWNKFIFVHTFSLIQMHKEMICISESFHISFVVVLKFRPRVHASQYIATA